MRPSIHVTASLGIGILLGWLTGSWQAAFWSCIGGVLIDLDHVIEYGWVRRERSTVKGFFKFWEPFQEQKVYLIFHVAEAVFLLGIAAGLGFYPIVTGGLAIGMGHHLLLDQWGNKARGACYFLSHRVMQRFETQKLFYVLEKK